MRRVVKGFPLFSLDGIAWTFINDFCKVVSRRDTSLFAFPTKVSASGQHIVRIDLRFINIIFFSPLFTSAARIGPQSRRNLIEDHPVPICFRPRRSFAIEDAVRFLNTGPQASPLFGLNLLFRLPINQIPCHQRRQSPVSQIGEGGLKGQSQLKEGLGDEALPEDGLAKAKLR